MKELKATFRTPYRTLPYCFFSPEKAEGKLPLIVFLHGAGERGDSLQTLDKVKVHGLPKYIAAGAEYPAYVLAPQCPENAIWSDFVWEVKDLLDYILDTYPIDRDRVTMTGLSMGGYGTFSVAVAFPEYFRAIAPICGGAVSWECENLRKVPVWAFHGDADDVVPVRNSIEMVDRINAVGGNAKLTLFHGCDHNSWEPAYETTKLIEWLIG